MKKRNFEEYRAVVSDLTLIETINKDIRKSFPQLGLPAKPIKAKVKKAMAMLKKVQNQ